jgi:hypothetical protein
MKTASWSNQTSFTYETAGGALPLAGKRSEVLWTNYDPQEQGQKGLFA